MSFLGRTIKELRFKRSMSLQEVADEAGLTKSHVWELETGRATNPTIRTLVGLSIALGTTGTLLAELAIADEPDAVVAGVTGKSLEQVPT